MSSNIIGWDILRNHSSVFTSLPRLGQRQGHAYAGVPATATPWSSPASHAVGHGPPDTANNPDYKGPCWIIWAWTASARC